MNSITKLFLSLFVLLFSCNLFAQNDEQINFTTELEQLDSKLKDLASKSVSFSLYARQIDPLLSFLNSEARVEYFVKHQANSVFQKRVIEKAHDSLIKSDKTLAEGIDSFVSSFSKIYPKTSLFILKLQSLLKEEQQLRDCINKKDYPKCIFEIALKKDSLLKNSTSLLELIKNGYEDQDSNSLTKLMLYYLEASQLLSNSREAACYKNALSLDFSDILSLDDELVYNTLADANSIMASRETCKDYVLKNLELLSKELCMSGFEKSCFSALNLLEKFGSSGNVVSDIKLNLILNSKDTRSTNVAKIFLDKALFSKMTFGQKIKVFISGKLPFFVYIIAFILLVLPLLLVSMYFLLPSFFKKRASSHSPIKNAERLDEYSTLLEVFDLPEDATGSDIKKAYRSKMKALHPDVNKDSSQEEIDRVQEAYDRIMHLRKAWFGTDR